MCRDMGERAEEERGETILVSACLLGEKCKYSGESNYCQSVVDYLKITGRRSSPVCPEVLGGLRTPRTPAEIRDERVVTKGRPRRDGGIRKGAEETLQIAREKNCRRAVLKEKALPAAVVSYMTELFQKS